MIYYFDWLCSIYKNVNGNKSNIIIEDYCILVLDKLSPNFNIIITKTRN